jgi:hypothetical protein
VGLNVPAIFPSKSSVSRYPLPSRGSPRVTSPPSQVLRDTPTPPCPSPAPWLPLAPATCTECFRSLLGLAHPYHPSAWSFVHPVNTFRDYETGDREASQVPGEPLSCTCRALRPRWISMTSPVSVMSILPSVNVITSASTLTIFSRLNHTAHSLAVYA